MRRFSTSNKVHPAIKWIGAGLFWLAVWQIASMIVDLDILLPSPYLTAKKMLELITDSTYWTAIGLSFLHIVIGYSAGCVFGILFGYLMHRYTLIDVLISPVMSLIRAVPVASFIILALVWIGRENIPPFIAFLMVVPVVSTSVKTGLESVDRELTEVARIYRFTRSQRIHLLYKPAVLPHLVSSTRVTLGLAWKASVAAEVLCSLSRTIGGNIHTSRLVLETDTLFAWTITVIIISILFESLLYRAFSRMNPTARRMKSDVPSNN